MKKIILLLCVAITVTVFVSCKKCVTCTEAGSQYTTDFCGPTPDVNKFESDLKSEGAKVGQSWSCVTQ